MILIFDYERCPICNEKLIKEKINSTIYYQCKRHGIIETKEEKI